MVAGADRVARASCRRTSASFAPIPPDATIDRLRMQFERSDDLARCPPSALGRSLGARIVALHAVDSSRGR